jgi:hypothetical protein
VSTAAVTQRGCAWFQDFVDPQDIYADQGTGEPLLLVHGGVFTDWFLPLATSTALEGFRIIRKASSLSNG